jgi:Flp pilus assembly protein TadG
MEFFIRKIRAFSRSARGNVVMMFALATVPLMIGAGVGLDYVRAMLVRQQMTEALDAAALAVGSSTDLDHDSAQALGQKFFNANYAVDKTAFGTPAVTISANGYTSTGSVVISATNTMPTVLVKLVGISSLPVTATSTVVWGQSKLWVALVLDTQQITNVRISR